MTAPPPPSSPPPSSADAGPTVARPRIAPAPRLRLSPIWLLPIASVLGALAIAWSALSARGPAIEIVFADAAGVRAGETTLRRRDIEVGRVEEVRFGADAREVIVTARVAPEIAPLLDAKAQFWVVRPQITTRGVTGLGSVLSGVHIETVWDEERGPAQTRFEGLAEPPLTPPNTPGLRLTLQATQGASLAVGAPVLFKGVEVGRIEAREIAESGDAIRYRAFIREPFSERVTAATRFWDVSGFEVELSADGPRLRMDSLVSLLQGGVAFADLGGFGGAPVEAGAALPLFRSESAARDSVLDGDPAEALRVEARFEGSVRGLDAGAPVEFRGIRVGAVETIALTVGAEEEPRLAARLAIQPARLGVADREAARAFLRARAARGLRAKLESGNLLTGALFVNLVEDGAGPAAFDEDGATPALETAPSDFEAIAASAEGVLARINALPVEELLGAATALFADLSALAADPAMRGLPARLEEAAAATARLVGSPEIVEAAAATAAALGALRESGAIEAAAAAFASVERAGAATAEALPPLAASVEQAAGRVGEADLAALSAAAEAALRKTGALAAEATASDALATAAGAFREVEAALAALRESGVAERLGAVAAEAEAAMKAANAAAQTVERSARSLPGLLAALTQAATRADAALAAFEVGSELNYEAVVALREVRDAARAVSAFTAAVDRRPNSLILGR